MEFTRQLDHSAVVLSQGSVYERMRREHPTSFDEHIGQAAMVYDQQAAQSLADAHREYMQVAMDAGLPMLAMAATWRANPERVARSRFADRDVNADQVRFLRDIAASMDRGPKGPPIFVAGVLGPKGDAYDPTQSLSRAEAEVFHRTQTTSLVQAGVDCLIAMTLPALEEARGLAALMAATDLPYLLSFVVTPDGELLDGTPLTAAIEELDGTLPRAPWGYMLNCIHPMVAEAALETCPRSVRDRVIGLKANTSRLSPRELDGSAELLGEDPDVLAGHMVRLHSNSGLKILGGCCGTHTAHLAAIAKHIKERP